MNIQKIKNKLSNIEYILRNAFYLLKEISCVVNENPEDNVGRDLVLRALDNKSSFGNFQHILNDLARQVGLFPYLDIETLSFRDTIAYEYHRPQERNSFVFHSEQALIFRRIMNGENIVLSAPTSFGKSRIVDEVINTNIFQNVALVVPTIALIDETRRRMVKFSKQYKIITQTAQSIAEKNIFILTAERINIYKELPKIDFFVIDEFYKLGNVGADEARTVNLNYAFYKLLKDKGQFFLIGPSIQSITENVEEHCKCYFYKTNFSTVSSNSYNVEVTDKYDALVQLCKELNEPTIIYCSSPKMVNTVANVLCDHLTKKSKDKKILSCYDWISQNYHPDWIYGRAIKKGIGIHYASIPRSLGQYSVRKFNESKLKFLICTSTLIEGVNTKAKNIIVFDNKIAANKLDFFTFNNIKGRSGRMFQHFIGNVYLFDAAPEEVLPSVEFLTVSQSDSTPESLLIQLDEDDLHPLSKKRLEYTEENILPREILRINSGVHPKAQINLAQKIHTDKQYHLLDWKNIPDYSQLEYVCELAFDILHKPYSKQNKGVSSGKQLAFLVYQLGKKAPLSERIKKELEPKNKFASKNVDEALNKILSFERNWASYKFPQYLMTISTIQQYLLQKIGLDCGDYSFYASQVESLFENPILSSLDEFGVPLIMARKLEYIVGDAENIDIALARLRREKVNYDHFTDFESDIISDALKTI